MFHDVLLVVHNVLHVLHDVLQCFMMLSESSNDRRRASVPARPSIASEIALTPQKSAITPQKSAMAPQGSSISPRK